MKFAYIKARSKHPFPIIAWLIMIFQGEKPWDKNATSHRALGYWVGETFWIVDSTGGKGFHDQLFHPVFNRKYWIVDQMDFEMDIDPNDFVEWVEENEGKKYDRLHVFGLALKLLGLVSFNTLGRNFKRLTCNEVMVHFMVHFGKLKVKDPDNWDLNMTDQMMERMVNHVH